MLTRKTPRVAAAVLLPTLTVNLEHDILNPNKIHKPTTLMTSFILCVKLARIAKHIHKAVSKNVTRDVKQIPWHGVHPNILFVPKNLGF